MMEHDVRKHGEIVGMEIEQRQLPVAGEDTGRQRGEMVATQPQDPQLSQRQQRTGLYVEQTVVLQV